MSINVLHGHNGCEPSAEHFGVMFTVNGQRCCSDYEGEFCRRDGVFDRAAAERQCVAARAFLEAQVSAEEPGRIFVTLERGALCHDCLAMHPEVDLGADETQVWDEYSGGWTGQPKCIDCKLSIPVYVDGSEGNCSCCDEKPCAPGCPKAGVR